MNNISAFQKVKKITSNVFVYLVLISVFWWKKHTFGYLFMKALKFNKKIDDVSTLERSKILIILVAFAAQNLIV